MEEHKKPSLIKSTMNYGAMLGLVLIIFSLLTWMFDATSNRIIGFLSFLIIIAGIVWGTKTYRDQELGGGISYGQALGTGTLISLFAGIITGFFTYLLYSFIDPGLIDKTLATIEQTYYEAGMTDSQIDTAISMAGRFTNPVMIAFSSILSTVFMGFLFSLITSIFLKKEENPFEHNQYTG